MELNKLLPKKNKITRNRPCKKEYYKEEQNTIVQKLNDIFNINESNNVVYLCDIEENKEMESKVIDMIDLVKLTFSCSKWGYFRNDNSHYFSLVKSIYKNTGHNIFGKAIDVICNDERIRTIKYIIAKNIIKE